MHEHQNHTGALTAVTPPCDTAVRTPWTRKKRVRTVLSALIIGSMLSLVPVSAHADPLTLQAPAPALEPGVTVTADESSPTGYTATFVYRTSDPGITGIVLYSDNFMLWDENAPQYTGESGLNLNNVSPEQRAQYGHLPNDYQENYWPGGGSGSSRLDLELQKIPGTDLWQTEVPLMSGAFTYNYQITKDGITTSRLDDPANPSLINTATGIRSLSSMVYVPYDPKQGTGDYRDRSIELPRTDGETGTVETITYPSAEGTDRGMSVYLPYGYDADRAEQYNVLYINMGNSGDQFGNELRWMNEGALPNIVDNLVAQGTEPFVAVSMNYQDWRHDFTRIEPDVVNNVLPFVESTYNVATDRDGRGYAGLSAGAGTTARFYLNHPDTFSQFGIWSNGVTPTEEQLAKIAEYEDSTTVHIALAKWDFVTAGRGMSDTLTANGIDHVFNEIPGGHDWEFWQLMLAEFAGEYLWASDEDPTLPVPVVPDTTAPTVSMKPNLKETDQGYRKVYFQFSDAGEVDKVVLNGVTTDLKNKTRTHLNGVQPGKYGAVAGANELKVYDVAGNVTTVTFTLLEAKHPRGKR